MVYFTGTPQFQYQKEKLPITAILFCKILRVLIEATPATDLVSACSFAGGFASSRPEFGLILRSIIFIISCQRILLIFWPLPRPQITQNWCGRPIGVREAALTADLIRSFKFTYSREPALACLTYILLRILFLFLGSVVRCRCLQGPLALSPGARRLEVEAFG